MKTKIFTAAAAALLITASAMAQETKSAETVEKKDNPPRTLIDSKNSHYSGYGGIYTRYSQIGGVDSCLVGGRGGLIINDNFVIGGGGMGLTYPQDRSKLSGTDYTGLLDRVEFGYGGFLMEYYFNPKDLIVLSAGTLIGGGGLVFIDEESQNNGNDDRHSGDKFFVVEPEVNIFVNVTRFCRIGVGASYRYVAGIKQDDFSDKDFRGATASVMAQFGWF